LNFPGFFGPAHDAVRAQGWQNPRVAPRQSSPRGLTYEEWAASLLQWVYSQPIGGTPLLDTTGTLTQQAQTGNVWFLPGPSELVPQPQQLSLTMPPGTAIFFSPLGFYAVGPTSFCPTVADCVNLASAIASDVIAVRSVDIDGVPVDNIDRYRVVSSAVPLAVPADDFWINFVGERGPFTFGVFGGFGLFIQPLAPGQHVLHAATTVPGEADFEITYTITVLP
jgi:hypothetical protein